MNTEDEIKGLLDRAATLAAESLAPSTRQSYRSDWRSFERFCAAHDLESLPADPSTVAAWIAAESERLAPSSILRAIVSIGQAHILGGYRDPTKTPEVRSVRAGLIRVNRGRIPRQAKPIYYDDLRAMLTQTDRSIAGDRDRALLCLGWACGARRSEIVALNQEDLKKTDQGLLVTFRATKTGYRVVAIPYIEGPIDFAAQILSWVETRLHLSHSWSAVFPSFGKLGRCLFATPSARLQPRAVRDIVARYARLAGLVGNYTAHSLRRGLVSEAARQGVPSWAIQTVTGHKNADQVADYIGHARAFIDSPLRVIQSVHRTSPDPAPEMVREALRVLSRPRLPEPSQE